MDHDNSPAVSRLRQMAIPHRVFKHGGQVNSLEQAALERDQQPEQVIRSLLFHLPDNRFVMVLMPGPGQVPWKSLRRYLNMSRITMASEEELQSVAGCQPGTVNPISVLQEVRILIAAKILDLPEISIGSCVRGLAIIMKPQDLLAAVGKYEVVNFSD